MHAHSFERYPGIIAFVRIELEVINLLDSSLNPFYPLTRGGRKKLDIYIIGSHSEWELPQGQFVIGACGVAACCEGLYSMHA